MPGRFGFSDFQKADGVEEVDNEVKNIIQKPDFLGDDGLHEGHDVKCAKAAEKNTKRKPKMRHRENSFLFLHELK